MSSIVSMVNRVDPNKIGGLDKDVTWLNECFMLPRVKATKNPPISDANYDWMYFTPADFKYVNTSIGGNFTINQPPGYTIFADPPVGLLTNVFTKRDTQIGTNAGMGQYYSEAIDDNAHRIYLRFGHMQPKGLFTFFTGFYSASAAMLANQGRTLPTLFYYVGFVLGATVGIALWVVKLVGWAAKLVLGRPSTSYWSMTPSMPLYWARVDTIANRIAAYMNLIPEPEAKDKDGKNQLESTGMADDEDVPEATKKQAYQTNYSQFNALMPGLFNSTGGIDVFRIINKTNRMLAEANQLRQEKYKGVTSKQQLANQIIQHATSFKPSSNVAAGKSLKDYLKMFHETPLGAMQLMGKDGKEYDVWRRDPVSDRMKEMGEKKAQDFSSDSSGSSSSSSETPTPETSVAQQSEGNMTGTNTSEKTEAKTENKSNFVSNFIGLNGVAQQSEGNMTGSTPASTSSTSKQQQSGQGNKSQSTQQTQTQKKDSKNNQQQTKVDDKAQQQANSTATTSTETTTTTTTETTTTSSSDGETSDTLLSNPPTGDEAKQQMREYDQQDSLIYSVLKVVDGQEDNEDADLERVMGWLSPTTQVQIPATQYFMEQLRSGAEFLGLKVDAVSNVSEGWQNSTTDGEIASAINGLSNTARGARYSLSDFRTGFDLIDGTIMSVRNTIAGLMDGFQVSGILALAGSGMVDIPKRYSDSSTQFPTSSYTIPLRSHSGDPMSVFLNIYLPYICILAGGVPISHGNQSYGAPFYCELYDRGRNTIRLGMIESISVTRGAGTVGWNPDGLPLGIDVQLSIANMSNIAHAPIDAGLTSLNPFKGIFAPDTAWNDYMGALANLSLDDMTNPYKKLMMNWAAYKISVDSYFNVARLGNWASSWSLSRWVASTAEAQLGFNRVSQDML